MMPLQRHIKNVVKNYTEAERKVREATSNDPWGPSSTLMSDIADRTYNVIAFTEIMQMIWRRLNDKNKNWRHVYKALILLEYIIKTGSDKVSVQCRENIHSIETLMEFYHIDEGKDVGHNVREKARTLNNLLRDEDRLQDERKKALLARDRMMHGSLGVTTNSSSGPGNSYTSLSPRSPSRLIGSSSDRRPSSQPSLCDFDSALPQSFGEEELQLQLALAISKEEHELDQRKRQEEEAKEALKLQMALEQSRREEQKRASADPVGDLFSQENQNSANNTSETGGSLFNLIDTSLSAAPAGVPDPWSLVLPSVDPIKRPNSNTFSSDHSLALINNAWTPREQSTKNVAAESNPWALLDPLSSPPTASLNTAHFSVSQNGTYIISQEQQSNGTNRTQHGNTAARKRSPSDFLGDHKDLVDLEKLVDRPPASTNPFAIASRPLVQQSTNPFNACIPPKPSLNQLTMNTTPLALPSNFPFIASSEPFFERDNRGGLIPNSMATGAPAASPFMPPFPQFNSNQATISRGPLGGSSFAQPRPVQSFNLNPFI